MIIYNKYKKINQSSFLATLAKKYFLDCDIGNLLEERAVSTRLIILFGDIAYFYGVSYSLPSSY
jgi:hypothetical protein